MYVWGGSSMGIRASGLSDMNGTSRKGGVDLVLREKEVKWGGGCSIRAESHQAWHTSMSVGEGEGQAWR